MTPRTNKKFDRSSQRLLVGIVDLLEPRVMLAGDVLFDISDTDSAPVPEFDPAYIDYLRDFARDVHGEHDHVEDEHHDEEHDHDVEDEHHDGEHDHHDGDEHGWDHEHEDDHHGDEDDHHDDEHGEHDWDQEDEHDHHDDESDDEPHLEVTPAEPSAQADFIGESVVWDGYDLSQTFELNSFAESDFTIFLDFDGHTTSNTFWNDNGDIYTPAYDIDGDSSTFSDSELGRIQRIWASVAEDFAPFDVHVTTQDPGVDALRRSGAGDSEWGIRVVTGENTFFDPAGGVAYIGSFDWNTDTPAFVFNTSEKGVAEAISHEVGHTLELRHDGTNSLTYYAGHGGGATGWAPILGAGYFHQLTQFSQGEYRNADNGEDDLRIITTRNGFGYRADDFGNDQSNATELLALGESSFQTTFGIIEQNTDFDYFSFYAAAGDVSIDVDPLAEFANLDILAQLHDSSGNVIATSNPLNELNATLDVTLAVDGEYFLSVTGTGKGDPLNGGYSDYGSLGNYRVAGTVTPFDPASGTSILVRASGNTGTEQFDLQINGSTVATFDVGTEFSTFEYSAFGVTADEVRVVFRNDSGTDTSLNVDWVSLDGVVHQTEASSVFSTGVLSEFGYEAGFGLGETLATDGYFQFDATINGADTQVDGLDGLRETKRAMTISLDAEEGPLVINLRTGTLTTSRGTVDIPDTIRRINATGTTDNDQIFVVGTDANSRSLIREGFARVNGDGITVIGRGFENVHSFGTGGEDSIVLRGKRRTSELVDQNADRTILNSDDFNFFVYNYESVRGLTIGDGSTAGSSNNVGGLSSSSQEIVSTNDSARTLFSGQAVLRFSQFDSLFDLDSDEEAS